jgi:putative two-component system response regulator
MEPPVAPPIILIIEDTVEIGTVIAELLQSELTCQTVHVADGTRAVEVLKGLKPTLILLDLNLPGFNGLEVYDWMQAQPELAAIPVLWMTASPNDQAFQARGFTNVVHKPFELDTLLAEVTRLLGSAR